MKFLTWIFFLCTSISLCAQEDTTNDITCHCIRNLTPAGVMISHVHPKKKWMLSYRFSQMNMGNPIQGKSNVSSSDIYNEYLMYTPSMQMNMHMLMGMVGITDHLTVMGMFHYMQNHMPMEMMTGHNHFHNHSHGNTESSMDMHTSGLGDTKLYAMYGLIKSDRHQLVISNGISLPTGNYKVTGITSDMLYEGKRYPYMMQLGSGSWEYFPNITYVYQKSNWATSVQTSGVIRLNDNKLGYRLGNEWYTNAWFGYNWLDQVGSTLRIESSISEQIQGKDTQLYAYNELGANPANYGGTRLFAFIGSSYELDFSLLSGCRIAFEYGIPLYQQLHGLQNKSANTWHASLNYSF
ncbi:MAG: hypothetical protein ACK48V_02600 [Crocinitomicaceae bacterium]|jgi:hypothetical protein